MSFRGRNTSKFRRSGSHDKPFKGRGRTSDRFHQKDFDGQIDITDRVRRRGRGFSGSPRSKHLRGVYHKNRGRGSFRQFEDREFRFSPQRPQSPSEWFEEGSIHLIDDNQEFSHQRRRSQTPPLKWFDDCDDSELLENCTRHSNGRPISPLIIHRNFEREDFENARERSLERRERSLERRERSPFSDRSRSLGRHPFRGPQERSRSPLSMRSFRGEIQVSLGRPRSQLSMYSIRRRDIRNSRSISLERPGSRTSLHSRRYRRGNSNHSGEIRKRPHSRQSFCSGESFKNRYRSRSPNRCFGRRSESRFSVHSRSFEKRFERERSFGRMSNSGFSIRSGSLKRHENRGSRKGSTIRNRSPFSSHSRDYERSSLKHDNTRVYNIPGSSFYRARSFERDDFIRDKSLPRCFSPARKQSDKDRFFDAKSYTHSFQQQYQGQTFEHQRRCHEKRSESSIERFLNDCKQSVEKKKHVRHLEQSERPNRSRRKFKGLDHIVIERGKSFERSVSPDGMIVMSGGNIVENKDVNVDTEERSDKSHLSNTQNLKQKSQITENRLSPISSKSGCIDQTVISQHSDKQSNCNVSPISNFSLGNKTEFSEKDNCIDKTEIVNATDVPNTEENFNLSPISKASLLEKIELAERKDIENRLSPISSQSGSIGKEGKERGDIFADQEDLNLSPISQSSSKYQISEKAYNLSPISQVECFEDEKSNDLLPTRKHKVSVSNDSMQEFLAELERDEISGDQRSSPENKKHLEGPFKIVPDNVFGGWKKVYITTNKEQSNSTKQCSSMENINTSQKPYFEVVNLDENIGGFGQTCDALNNKFEPRFGKPYEHSNLKVQTPQPHHRPLQTTNFTVGQAMKDSNISYPLKHTVNTFFPRAPQIQQFGSNSQVSTIEHAYNKSPKQSILENSKPNSLSNQISDQILRSPYISLQDKLKTVSNMCSRPGNSNMEFPSYSQNINERDNLANIQTSSLQMFPQAPSRQFEFKGNAFQSQNLGSTSFQNRQYQQNLQIPQLPNPSNSFGSSIQAPNHTFVSTGNKSAPFHQEVNKPLSNPQMPQHFQMEPFRQSKPMGFQTPSPWHMQHSRCPRPNWTQWPNQNNSYLAGTGPMPLEKSDQNRSNLKPVNISTAIMQTNVQSDVIPAQTMYQTNSTGFPVTPLNLNNTVQSASSFEKSQTKWSCDSNQSNYNLPTQQNPQLPQISTTNPTPVDIKKCLAPIFGRNYFPLVFPQTKEVITISDDEEVDFKSGAQITKQNMNIVQNLVPSSVFVEKYRDSPPSPEDMKQMFETFVIYFGVRNNSQLEKDPFLVIQDSFARSQRFGALYVEEIEEYHDFLPVPKQ